MEANNNFLTQAELFKSYSEQNSLYCNLSNDALWFEHGGKRIGRMSLEIQQLKLARRHQMLLQNPNHKFDESSMDPENTPVSFQWRSRGVYRNAFSPFLTMVYVNETDTWFLMGGQGNRDTNLAYTQRKLKVKAQMPQEKTFFPAVYHKGVIYTFGGYDSYDKC